MKQPEPNLTVDFFKTESAQFKKPKKSLAKVQSYRGPIWSQLVDYLSNNSKSACISLSVSENHGHQKIGEEKRKNMKTPFTQNDSSARKTHTCCIFFKLNPNQIVFIVVKVYSNIFKQSQSKARHKVRFTVLVWIYIIALDYHSVQSASFLVYFLV